MIKYVNIDLHYNLNTNLKQISLKLRKTISIKMDEFLKL